VLILNDLNLKLVGLEQTFILSSVEIGQHLGSVTIQGKRLTVANATKISSGQPILRVAIAQLATYKIYLARCLRCQSRSEHIKFNYVESP